VRAAWEWWSLLGCSAPYRRACRPGLLRGPALERHRLYVVVALAFWIVLAGEGKALIGEPKRRRIARLMAFREEGVQIMNRDVRRNNDNDVLLHRHAVVDWDERVRRVWREAGVPESDIGWFATLGSYPIRVLAETLADSPMYLQYQNILAEELERLLVIVRRLEDREP
jgi:hypothetical protein